MGEQPLNVSSPSADVRQWAMFCHLAAFCGLLFPFGNLLGPLIIWQWKRELDPFIDAQGKESLNFQITVTIAYVICIALFIILIGFALLGLLVVAAAILMIIASVKVNEGQAYRYPFTWRVIQ